MEELIQSIKNLAEVYSANLKGKIEARTEEMKTDDNSHYLIYRVLGITLEQGQLIDSYQNTGRFLYKYAGSFLEDAATLCLKYAYPEGIKTKVENTMGQRPKTFEIDALVEQLAFEIKWRDATTDGDHITKEHTRLNVIHAAGYTPIRLMFYYPNRTQAKRIQATLETLYKGLNGQYYYGDSAWKFINEFTGVDLLAIIERIAREKTKDAS